MGIKKYILLVLSFALIQTGTVNSQNNRASSTQAQANTTNESYIIHTVKMGETAYSIANFYKTTVEDIYKLNPGSDKGINIGQPLKVPNASITQGQGSNVEISVKPHLFKHKIEPKETLFSVSQKYNITVAELLKANPGLSETNFSIGKEIIIPDIYTDSQRDNSIITSAIDEFTGNTHQVQKQETLYSISKKYNCSIENLLKANPSIKEFGLRQGDTIVIPTPTNNGSQTNYDRNLYTDTRQFDNLSSTIYLPQDGIVRIALLLPFIHGSKNVSQSRITEYYEGFLLAVQKMKERGMNAEIYTFDIGTDNDVKRLESILGTNELSSLNLIIGGISDKQVQLISRFSQKTGTKYVVPFSNKHSGVEYNKNIFQIANSHTTLYSIVTKGFVNKFRNNNVIFITESGSDKNKSDFVQALQKELSNNGIGYKTAPDSPSITDNLNAVIDKNKKNIIVPTSSSEASLRRIIPALDLLNRDEIDLSLFGYPEWQTYANMKSSLHQYNSFFYGMFFLDNTEPEVQLFADKYKRWYNKNLVASFPKFAYMGYDTGIVFLTALQKLGHDFPSRINDLKISTLQSAMFFEPVDAKGGYANTGMYFVNLKPDGSAEKIEVNKQ